MALSDPTADMRAAFSALDLVTTELALDEIIDHWETHASKDDRASDLRIALGALLKAYAGHVGYLDDCPPAQIGYALGVLVSEASDVARGYGWSPHRESISAKKRTLVYRRDGYACVLCGADDVQRLTIDHRIPVALGGGDEPENLRTLCKSCNSSKGARV